MDLVKDLIPPHVITSIFQHDESGVAVHLSNRRISLTRWPNSAVIDSTGTNIFSDNRRQQKSGARPGGPRARFRRRLFALPGLFPTFGKQVRRF